MQLITEWSPIWKHFFPDFNTSYPFLFEGDWWGEYTHVSGCLLECMHMCPCVGVGVRCTKVNMETGGWGTV